LRGTNREGYHLTATGRLIVLTVSSLAMVTLRYRKSGSSLPRPPLVFGYSNEFKKNARAGVSVGDLRVMGIEAACVIVEEARSPRS
jgi:hypothetical protein